MEQGRVRQNFYKKSMCQEKTLDKRSFFVYDTQGGAVRGCQERKMNKILEQTLLYDFYGELLTEHQKQIYEDVVLNDYSFSEVAAEQGISRQGVHDLIKRCNKILQEYESKLHLVEKFVTIKNQIEEMESSLQNAEEPDKETLIRKLNDILENL